MQVFFTSLLIGIIHVLSGPDHLAAVSPLAADNNKSWKVGFFWSIGHTFGVFILGVIFFFFKDILNLYKLTQTSEKIVAFTVIFIGVWAIVRQFNKRDKKDLSHFHKHSINAITLVGLIHGLAGFSHIIGILPTLVYPSLFQSIIYLIGFTIGTILTMVVYALIIGIINKKLCFIPNWHVRFCVTLGVISIIIGVYWLFI